MKRFLLIPAVLIAAGCGTSETAPGTQPGATGEAPPAIDSREMQLAIIDASIANKNAELAGANADLSKIGAERQTLAGQSASQTKTNRLAQLVKLETDTRRRKESIQQEISVLQSQRRDLTAKAASADDALDLALAGEADRQKQEAERKRLEAERRMKEEQRQIAEAERARQARQAQMKREAAAIGGGRTTGEDALFEETWADVILGVRAELQKFKRW